MLEKSEGAQQERLAEHKVSKPSDLESEDQSGEAMDASSNGNNLSSALGSTLAQLLKRPEIVIEDLASVVRESYPEYFAEIAAVSEKLLSAAARNELKTVQTEIKYAGYLDQQRKSIDRLKKAEQRVIPEWFDYSKVSGLSREMNEKLQRVRPRTLGQASRIPGVTPAAVSLINVFIELQSRLGKSAPDTRCVERDNCAAP